MKSKLCLILAALTLCGAATAQTDTLAVDTTLTLGEVTVNGMRTIQKVDRTLFLSPPRRWHARRPTATTYSSS